MPLPRTSSVRAVLVAAAAALPFMAFAPEEAVGANGGKSAQAPPTSRDFYLRAGIAFDRSRETRFQDRDCSSKSPAALYGCGIGSDGAPLSSVGNFGRIDGFEAGLGYVASPVLRVEGTIQYRPSFSFSGQANFLQDRSANRIRTVRADLSAVSAIFSAYLDLTELGLRGLGPFSPFVGGGLGLTRVKMDETRMEFEGSKTTTIVPGERRTNFTWTLTAGLAMPLGERMTLDLAWRYMDSGTVETGRGGGVACRIETCSFGDFLKIDFAHTRANLRSHGLQVSVRYAL